MNLAKSAMSDSPTFLVGCERSGTTLLRLMLDHHPQLCWRGEFEYAVKMVNSSGGWPSVKDYTRWLKTHRIFLASGFDLDLQLDYPNLVRSFLEQARCRSSKPLVGATVHRYFDRLLHIWPNARFIHLYRDPRDVSRSWIQMGWGGTVRPGALCWAKTEQLWDRLRSSLAGDRFIDVQYERLIENPEETLTLLCEFLGVNYHKAMLSYPEKTTYGPPDISLVEQWRRKLAARDIQLVEALCGEMLPDRGYERSGLPRLAVSRARLLVLGLKDRWAGIEFKIRRFGLALALQDAIARRIGPRSWNERIKLRINRIQTSYLK